MANKRMKIGKRLAKKICDELNSKIENYESRMTLRLSRWLEVAELYSGKTATGRENSKISPNSAELYKAVRAISNMQFRMLTGQAPFFELRPLDIVGHKDPTKIIKSEHYVENQLELSQYKRGLYKGLNLLNLYGSVAMHEQYEPLRQSFLGVKRYVTSFRPVSMINCAFALDGYDADESGWVCINDIQSKGILEKLKRHDPLGVIYDLQAIDEILNQPDYNPQVNMWVTQRMAWSGYMSGNFFGGIERSTYYGPLECIGDGEEYAIEMINRSFIIRAESYEGIRPVRIATIDNVDIEPLGNGLGDHFRPLLGKIDDAESSLLNMITLAGANMFTKQKEVSDEDMEFVIRNFGILSLDNPQLNSISPDARNLTAVSQYRQEMVNQFRQSSGATDTLQAIVAGDSATATEVSLSMNEAVRNISVGSELLAPILVGQHIKVVLQNGQKYQTQPFTLTIAGTPIVCAPADLLIDTDVIVKTATDQDFRPARARNLLQAAQIMTQVPPNSLTGIKLDPTSTLVEVLKLLDVPDWQHSVTQISNNDLIRAHMIASMTNAPGQPGGAPAGENPNTPGQTAAANRQEQGKPGRHEQRVVNRNMAMGVTQQPDDTMHTPVGPVLQGPGDASLASQAIQRATIGGDERIINAK